MTKSEILQKLANHELTVEEASRLLASTKGNTPSATTREREYLALYTRAHEAGMAAGNAATPTPMLWVVHPPLWGMTSTP
ncbi:MAG: DUF2089 domain-containing protein [Blastochloris sp.]|nr:DUF2089 domain-containing protein [Blastochloris sp.]